MVTTFISLNAGQLNRARDNNSPASGDLTSSSQTPVPPDPPDLNRSDQISMGKPPAEGDRAQTQQNGLITRLSKVGFPPFDGSGLRGWLYRCEQFFSLDGTLPEMKVRYASMHMEGKALEWHHNYIRDRFDMLPSWPEYVVDVSARFAELVDDPLAELVNVKQGGDPVEVFWEKFECARTRLSLPMPHALSIFLTNLNPHLALQARQFKVTTITKAARIAKLHEAALLQTPTKPQRSSFTPFSKPYSKPSNTTAILPTPKFTESPKHCLTNQTLLLNPQ